MFEKLMEQMRDNSPLSVDVGGHVNERDIQLAVLALLVNLSKIDSNFSGYELHRICTLMLEEFGIMEEQSAEMLEVLEFFEKDEHRRKDFISVLQQHLDLGQRERVMALCWRLIVADKNISGEETTQAAHLRKELGLNLIQASRARALGQEAQELSEILKNIHE